MSKQDTVSARWARLMNRLAARRAAWSGPATAFLSRPEPRTIGSHARGRQLMAGNFVFAGLHVEAPDLRLWDIPASSEAFSAEQHGFGWLDDLAAVGDPAARQLAQGWLAEWIARHGRGSGPGWTPELTGRRLIRWISHALFLMAGRGSDLSEPFLRSLAQQTRFLSQRWQSSTPGLPRFEALTGLLYASLSLEGMEPYLGPALKALDRDCETQVGQDGAIPTRNPEELLEVFTLLTWSALALSEAGRSPSAAHWGAIERIAPTLRSLRHADGGLARFHGGGRGLEGRLDAALATSGVKYGASGGLAMGFARLSAGRTSVIVDAAPPPHGRASTRAHASTLAFELTSGRRPVIVNCGSGASFGHEWRRAGRASPSHSTLILAGRSSSRLGASGESLEWLEETPSEVPVELARAQEGIRFEGAHDGYRRRYGLTHIRKLDLSFDGRGLTGEDTLMTLNPANHGIFDAALDRARLQGIPYDIRFHLHPEVDTALDMGGAAVSLALKSGEIWIFRIDEAANLNVEASVYLEKHRLKPRETKQIVLSGRVMEYASRVRWSLAKAQETPLGVRDLATEEADPLAVD